MTATTIFADLTNRQLVASDKSAAVRRIDQPERPGQYDKLHFAVQPLLISASPQNENPYTTIDAASYTVSVVLVKQSDGTVLAGPNSSWTVDETRKLGALDLNTAAMATAMSGQTAIACYIEWKFDDGANVITTIRQELYVQKAYITPSTPTELPLSSYLTRDECIELFVRWSNNVAGKKIALKDSTSTYERTVGCNTDATADDSIVTI